MDFVIQKRRVRMEENMAYKAVVFDLGGTLMRYAGMPYSWVDFYYKGFETMIQKYKIHISQEVVLKSVQMLKEFNPRVNYREIEYPAEYIFTKILEDWHIGNLYELLEIL